MYNYCVGFESLEKVYRDQSATDLALKGIYIGMRELGHIQRTPIQGRRWYVSYKEAGKVLRM